ncbi:hypothetical protein EXIGLDRAFT_624316 [Exidia glandulosa HHB12029]|uniref:Reverse transcriptase zinc-binding domain-containing protein n=1 Tax=Exidia glandulosa HHB12029 TaxID=1314781 RepID=A0A165DEF1_EXIGL|nr:hypothetical protein EXIGLDRAFT_624316 [Exidia glandulosa HHB12029]
MLRALDLAKKASTDARTASPDPNTVNGPDIPGTRIRDITQGQAYRLLLAQKPIPERRGTYLIVGRIRAAVAEVNGSWPSAHDVWINMRLRDFSRQIREFLWRGTHNLQKVGKYWLNIKHKEHRSECPPCEVLETMDHILFECTALGQEIIWAEAKKIWSRTAHAWPEMSLGLVFGCGLIVIRNERGKAIAGATRLLRILISEAAYLIWKIRNERRIKFGDDPEQEHTEEEIIRRFKAAINKRLRMDMITTSKRKFKQRALPLRLMRATWEDILLWPDGGMPDKWWARPELLVSIWPPRPRGRER